MHNRRLAVGFLLCITAVCALAQTEDERQQTKPDPEKESVKAEYTRRSLPADTFKPSEEISEDFPVPFPVDI